MTTASEDGPLRNRKIDNNLAVVDTQLMNQILAVLWFIYAHEMFKWFCKHTIELMSNYCDNCGETPLWYFHEDYFMDIFRLPTFKEDTKSSSVNFFNCFIKWSIYMIALFVLMNSDIGGSYLYV